MHDNGEKPFMAVISDTNRVRLYAKNKIDNNGLTIYHDDPFYDKVVKQTFIGHDVDYGTDGDGNSLLLHEEDLTYTFVGECVRRFKAIAPIVRYSSLIGNSDVPYPYAVDEFNNYYLMIENVIINSDLLSKYADPYDYYYEADLITNDIQFQVR